MENRCSVSDPLTSSFISSSTSAQTSPDLSEDIIKREKSTDEKNTTIDGGSSDKKINKHQQASPSSVIQSSPSISTMAKDGLRRRGGGGGGGDYYSEYSGDGSSPNTHQHHHPPSVMISKPDLTSVTVATPVVKPFAPTVVLDGSKLILRLAKNGSFVIDNPCKILMVTPNVRLERPVAWQTNGTCTEQENTVVIDCGLLGHRFVPIPLAHYGTIYTRDGTVHVTVGPNVRRAKVHSRNLPYRACNKFHSVSVLETETPEEEAAASASGWLLERQNTSNALASVDPAQAVKLIKQLTSDPRSGIVYIRADDSVLRYRLGHDEKVELHSGRVVAWTVAVRFEQANYCCCRFVKAVHGEGTVWIQNSRGAL